MRIYSKQHINRALMAALVALNVASFKDAYAQPTTINSPTSITQDPFGDENAFGWTTCVDGSTLIVGAPSYDNFPIGGDGQFHVYTADPTSPGSWTRLQTFSTTSDELDSLGESCAINNGQAFIGTNTNTTGAVFVYNIQPDGTFLDASTLASANATQDAFFGKSVSSQGNQTVVGAPSPFDSSGAVVANNGVAYVYENINGSWTESARLSPPSPSDPNSFGESTDISNNRIIVGATASFISQSGPSAAYIFEHDASNWNLVAPLSNPDNTANTADHFGISVGIDNDWAAVGDPEFQSVYLYQRDNTNGNWNLAQTIAAGGLPTINGFGAKLKLKDNTLFVSNPLDAVTYIYENQGGTWVQTYTLPCPTAIFHNFRLVGTDVDFDPNTNTFVAGTDGRTAPSFRDTNDYVLTYDIPDPSATTSNPTPGSSSTPPVTSSASRSAVPFWSHWIN